MSRKAFIIWGLVIISLSPITVAVVQYLGLSRLIEIDSVGLNLTLGTFFLTPLAFGALLHLRFKEIGRRKRILVLCIGLYLFTLTMTNPSTLYNDYVIMDSGAQTRFIEAIGEWAQTHDADSLMTWTVKQKLDYVLIMLPMSYLHNWGLFALLAFGSLDPRKPSNNRVVQFLKSGFQWTSGSAVRTDLTEVAHG